VWTDERDKWLDFWNLPITVLHGPKKDKLLAALPPASYDRPDIVTVTYEGLDWLTRNFHENFNRLDADVLIADESTYVKNTRTARFKNLKPLLPHFRRRIILTGTPIPRSYEDLFGQIYVVDRGGALGQYITHYRQLYFNDVSPHGADYSVYELKPGAEKIINDRVRPLVLRGDKDDYLQLPKLLHNVIEVELPPDARAAYDVMEERYHLLLDSGAEITAPTAAALGNKLRQIANGFVYDENGYAEPIHLEKIEALADLVASLQGKPALVAYEYIEDANRIARVLGDGNGLPRLRASMPEALERQYIADFNAGKLPVLLVHPQSSGHGLNLQESAGHVIWYGPTWNLELYDQLIQRVYRSGNPNERVTIHTIAARGTKDEQVAAVLALKDGRQKAMLKALKRPTS
jgi:SNF2 family DNA or RNA helicase